MSRFFRLFDGEFAFQLTRHPFLAGADLSQLPAGFWWSNCSNLTSQIWGFNGMSWDFMGYGSVWIGSTTLNGYLNWETDFFLPSVYCAIAHFQTNHDKPNESGVNHWISWDLGPQRLRGCGIMLVWDYVDPSKKETVHRHKPDRYSITHRIGNQYQMTSGNRVCIIFRKANLRYCYCTMTREQQ